MEIRGYNMGGCRLCQSFEGPFLNEEEMKKFNDLNKNGLERFMKLDAEGRPHRICYRCSDESSELVNFMEESVNIRIKYRSSVNELAIVKTEIMSRKRSKKEQDEKDSCVSTASPSTQSTASVTDCDNPKKAKTKAKSNATPKTEITSRKRSKKEQDEQDSCVSTASPSTQSPASVTDCDNPKKAKTKAKSNATPKESKALASKADTQCSSDQDRRDEKALKRKNKIQTVPVSQFGSFVHLCNICKSVFPEATKVHFCPKKRQPTTEFLTTITSAILEKMPSTEELYYGKTYQS